LLKLGIARALVGSMTEARWRELALLIDAEGPINGHPRLLRSLHWNDDDYSTCVFDVLPIVLGERRIAGPQFGDDDIIVLDNIGVVSEFISLDKWLAVNDPQLYERLFENNDMPDTVMADGILMEGIAAAAARLQISEMQRHISRIRRDYADDPEALVSNVKDLLETTMKAMLGLHGESEGTKKKLTDLTDQTLRHLGLHPADLRADADSMQAAAAKRVTGSAMQILQSAGELRNARGLGHGRSRGPIIDPAFARLTASLALAILVYLCEVFDEQSRSLASDSAPEVRLVVRADRVSNLAVGDGVVHGTFGRGVVDEVLPGGGDNEIAVIRFEDPDVGKKRLLLKYAPLKKW
jgi:hypothetical protein